MTPYPTALCNQFVFAKTAEQIISEYVSIIYQIVLFFSIRQFLSNLLQNR